MTEAKNSGFDTVIVDTAGRLHIDDELMTELAGDPGGGRVDRSLVCRGCDDRSGRDQERRRVQSADWHQRRRADRRWTATPAAARRSRSSASSGCRSRSSAAASGCRTSSRSIPIASCRVCSAWATCCRSSRRRRRRSRSRTPRSSKRRLRLDDFTLEDFRDQLRTIKKMGPLEQIIGMLPGHGAMKELAANREKVDDKQLDRIEAMINSMTPQGAAESSVDQRQPPQTDRQGQRHVGRGNQSPVEAVRSDEEDAQGDGRDGRPRQEEGRPRDDEVVDEVRISASFQSPERNVAGDWNW